MKNNKIQAAVIAGLGIRVFAVVLAGIRHRHPTAV